MKQRLFFLFFFISSTNFAQQPKLMLPIGHTAGIEHAEYSPDYRRILTSSYDQSAKIWDAQTGFLLASLSHPTSVNFAHYNNAGDMIVTCSDDSLIRLWSAKTGSLLKTLQGHTEEVLTADFSSDGRKLCSSSYDGTGRIWDTETGKQLNLIEGDIMTIAFNKRGDKVVTVSWDTTCSIWDAHSGNLLIRFREKQARFYSARFGSNDSRILTLTNDHMAKVWDAHDGTLLYSLDQGGYDMKMVTDPSGDLLAVGSDIKKVNIWNINTGKMVESFPAASSVYGMAFSTDSKQILIATWNEAVVWEIYGKKKIHNLDGNTGWAKGGQFHRNGKSLFTYSYDNTIKIWNRETGSLVMNIRGHTTSSRKVLASPDGNSVFISSGSMWDVHTGRMLFYLKGINDITHAAFTKDSKMFATASRDTTVIIWDAGSAKKYLTIKGYEKFISHLQFNFRGDKLLTATSDGTIYVTDVKTKKPLLKWNAHEEVIGTAEFSPDDKYILTTGALENTARIWDAGSGKLVRELTGHTDIVEWAQYSLDGNRIITTSSSVVHTTDKTARIWDPLTGKQLAVLEGHTDDVLTGTISPNGKKAATGSYDNTVRIWDAKTGGVIYSLSNRGESVYDVTFSKDNKWLLTQSVHGARVWEVESGKLMLDFDDSWQISDAVFNTDNNSIYFTTDGNTTERWDIKSGKQVCSFFTVDTMENFIQVASGYYSSTPRATKLLHYVTSDLKVITFEQLDVRLNRPDKVLEALGSSDTSLIKGYRKAWEKRIKKLGIDTTAFREGFSVPEADFANRNNLDFEQRNGKLTLSIKSVDSLYQLDRFNIWINEVPVYSRHGISLRNKNKHSFDSTITIELSPGENKIETSITNVNGTESYRMPLTVNYTPADSQKTRTYFIGIGIDKFSDSTYNLKYSTKDIRDLSKKLKEKYTDIIIDTLFNEDVTIDKVKALKQKLLQTTVNDKVIISYSGHGMLSKDFDYYLSTYAVNFDRPEENGLSYDELESLLDSIPARKKLMLIDACHSGEVDKDDLIAMNGLDSSGIKRGLKPVAYKKEGQLGLKNSFELMQSLFVNVGKSTGATIISAAAGTQFALEGVDNLPNGVFTYSILEAMNKYPTMKISALKKIVGDRVVEITKGLQRPTSRNETIAVDWEIW